MPDWQETLPHLQQTVKAIVRFVKARKREEATIGLAALLFWLGFSLPKFFPPETDLSKFINSWHGVVIAQCLLYIAGASLLLYGGYRIWQLVLPPDLPPPKDRPTAIKGPVAFAPADGDLFRRLGREEELRKLLGFIEDDQVQLVVLMGASGVGKTSLLRAGLTNILKNKGIEYHYWEAVPTASGQRLLRAIQESWQLRPARNADDTDQSMSTALPASLEDLINPAPALGERRHVIVLDQFEQLHGSSAKNPVLSLLRKVAREAKPPHRVTWIVTFRREFRAEWEDITMEEKARGIYPAELPLRLFTAEQAREVIGQLIVEAKLSIHQKVVDNLVAAATVDGEVSPVDIGIGLLALAESHERQGGQTVTLDDYQFAGGAEGLLTQYLSRCLDIFPEPDQQTILNAMLALRESDTNQRIAEGRTCTELAQAIKASNADRLKTQLERLTQRDVRLLEIVAPTDNSETRYRLPHERLIPALHRLAGQVLAKVDQAKLRFENAFAAWKKSKQGQYLLKAGDLRTVERYETQIPWGKDASEKRAFLRRSQRRRRLVRLGLTAMALCLLAIGWLVNTQYQHYVARTHLADNYYPPELYQWQHQLKTLSLTDPVFVQRFPWLHSNSIEEFTIHVHGGTSSLDGLVASLTNCHALRKLNLDLGQSQVSDLTPLAKLTALTQLDLAFPSDKLKDLTPLAQLSALTQLTLRPGAGPQPDLTPLTKLNKLTHLTLEYGHMEEKDFTVLSQIPALTQLSLNLSYNFGTDLMALAKLNKLTQLSLNIGFTSKDELLLLSKLPALTQLTLALSDEVSDLTLLQLPALEQLNLDLYESKVSDLTPLTKLPALTQLNLKFNGSHMSDLTPLIKLTTLTQLTLDLRRSQISDLTPLTKLSALKQLNLDVRDSKVSNLTPLTKLPALTQLNLELDRRQLSDLTLFTKLPALMQLTLDLSGTDVSDLTPLTKLPVLTQLNLNLGYSDVSDLTPLMKLPAITQLTLNLSDSKVSDLTPLTKLSSCQTLVLKMSTNQRMSLKALPASVTHLEF